MRMSRSLAGKARMVLPVLALLLAAAGALVVFSLFALQDVEESCVVAQIATRRVAVEKRLARARSRNAPARRGALIAAPSTQSEVRAMVDFCDTATSSDREALRETALHAESPLAAGNAIRALGRLHAVVRDPELVALLRDRRERVRDETVLALGESRNAEAVELLEPFVRDADRRVRLLALRAIGRVGGERAESVLRSVRDDPSASREEQAFAQAAR